MSDTFDSYVKTVAMFMETHDMSGIDYDDLVTALAELESMTDDSTHKGVCQIIERHAVDKQSFKDMRALLDRGCTKEALDEWLAKTL